VGQFEQIHIHGVILKDFSPEEPALSVVEGILRAAPRPSRRIYGLRARSFASSGWPHHEKV